MYYYEVLFNNGYGICIRGLKKPSIKEAEEFCKDDMELFESDSVEWVEELSYSEACKYYDMETDDDYPVFGKNN